jgi:hypothetical protein
MHDALLIRTLRFWNIALGGMGLLFFFRSRLSVGLVTLVAGLLYSLFTCAS